MTRLGKSALSYLLLQSFSGPALWPPRPILSTWFTVILFTGFSSQTGSSSRPLRGLRQRTDFPVAGSLIQPKARQRLSCETRIAPGCVPPMLPLFFCFLALQASEYKEKEAITKGPSSTVRVSMFRIHSSEPSLGNRRGFKSKSINS